MTYNKLSGIASGTLGAGTASASPTVNSLCIINNTENADVCAIANGSNAIQMAAPQSSTTNWDFVSNSITANGPGELEQINTTSCMQVDHDKGNIVIMATCNGQSYQEWTITSLGDQYESVWNPSLCLTYNAGGHDLVVGGCGNDWYQEFTGAFL